MEVSIGKQIHKYRKQKNMTQEQVAEALGVSTAAVSKWENQAACPDITMLAPLARLLEITVDELLGFSRELEEEDCMERTRKAEQLFRDGEGEKARNYCEELMKEYPRDLFLKFRVAGAYMMYLGAAGDASGETWQRDRAIQLFEAATESRERKIADAAWYTLSGLYLMKGDAEKAAGAAEHLYQMDSDIRLMKARILEMSGKTEEGEELAQKGLYQSLVNAGLFLQVLSSMAAKGENLERASRILEAGLRLQELFEMQNFAAADTSWYLEKALVSMQAGNPEEALENLRILAGRYKKLAEGSFGNLPVYFDRLTLQENHIYKDYLLQTARELFDGAPEFESLRGREEFQEIRGILE